MAEWTGSPSVSGQRLGMTRLHPLTDGVVVLDEPRGGDAEAMVAGQDEATRAAFGDDRPDTPEKAARWIARARDLWRQDADPFAGRWAIRLAKDDVLVGWLVLESHGDRANVRAWLTAGARGRRLGARALLVACEFAFREVAVDTVEANINPSNTASRALARSLGFAINAQRLTTSRDHAGMALLYELPRDAWPARVQVATKEALRRELADAEEALAAYDPDEHFVATRPGPQGELLRAHFHVRARAVLEDAVETAKRRLRLIERS